MANGLIVWSPGETLEQIERQVIQAAYTFYRGNKVATAQALGISERTLFTRFAKYEQEEKDEVQRNADERLKREEFLQRCRGTRPSFPIMPTPERAPQPEPNGAQALAGVRVEPAAVAAAKPAVPVPERAEVQGVLPPQSPGGGVRKGR